MNFARIIYQCFALEYAHFVECNFLKFQSFLSAFFGLTDIVTLVLHLMETPLSHLNTYRKINALYYYYTPSQRS